jgi:hypothetical protein
MAVPPSILRIFVSQVTAAWPLPKGPKAAFLAHSRFHLSRVVPFHRARNLSRTQAGNIKATCRSLLINPNPLFGLALIMISDKGDVLSLVIEYASLLRRSVSLLAVVPTSTCEALVGTEIHSPSFPASYPIILGIR